MMYLGLALFAEGPVDHRFLRPLLRRLCEDLCAAQARQSVELSEVLELHSPPEHREAERDVRILEAARDALGAWDILFIHTDGGGDSERARSERIHPGISRIREELGNAAGKAVAVIPVRETEAWALSDGDALRAAFGVTLADAHLGVPRRPSDVQSIPDPKQLLRSVWTEVRGRRRRRGSGVQDFLQSVAERARLDVLRRIPAFQILEDELTETLRTLGYLSPQGSAPSSLGR